jgi:fructuronate reductase
MGELRRLTPHTLDKARAVVPGYDRAHPPAILHLGVGGFARAHLGLYVDDLLRAGWTGTLRGVSLHSARAEDQLAPQDGLYTIAVREPGGAPPLQVIGSLTSVATGAQQAEAAIADPSIELVTLTITEKGYDLPAGGLPGTTSAPAVVARGLDARRRDGAAPPVVASLDNLSDNGTVLRTAVLCAAEQLDRHLASWIRDEVAFPSSVVDRMTPAATSDDLDAISRELGLDDRGAVVAERHRSWAMTAAAGLPPLDDVGVDVVDDIGPVQQRKLWLLNGPHSALAYCGLLTGHGTIAEAVADPVVSRFVDKLVEEVLDVVPPPTTDATAFARQSLSRFANPGLGHSCEQVGADGSRKLPERVLPVVRARLDRGLDTESFALVVATWLAAVSGTTLGGRPLPAVADPEAERLRDLAATCDDRRLAAGALPDWDERFQVEVAGVLARLRRLGAGALGVPA